MRIEAVLVIVFEDKPGTRAQYPAFEYPIGQAFYARHIEWGVGEYIVKRFAAGCDKAQHIGFYRMDLAFGTEHLCDLFYKGQGRSKAIHASGLGCPAGNQFIGMASRSAEQVQGFQRFKVEDILEDIEKPFPGNIRSRAGRPFPSGQIKAPALEFSTYDPHIPGISFPPGARWPAGR